MTHEIKPLTSIRALAAAVVFMYHFPLLWAQITPDFLHSIARQGFIGVDIFFVLSGFILTLQSTIGSLIGLAGIVGCAWLIDTYFSKVILIQRGLVYGIALFAAILIYSLTCEEAPLARLLSWRPFVFLGRISFALYLVQLTPLMSFMSGWTFIPLYLGANGISAALHLLVEQPMHRVIMKRAKHSAAPPLALDQPIPVESTN